MNKAKKIVRVEQQKQPKKNYDPEVRKQRYTMFGIGIAAVLFIAMCGMIFYEALHKDPVVYIGDESYYVTDVEVMYNVYKEEAAIESYAQSIAALWNGVTDSTTIWNTGSTKTLAKNDAMTQIVNTEVMYREAVENNLTLTEEETAEATETATAIFERMPSNRVRRTGFTLESFVEYAVKEALADKYEEELKAGYGINAETLAEPLDKEDYQERQLDVIYVATSTSDSEDGAVSMTDEEKEELLAQMNEYLAQVKAGVAFEDILDEDEETFIFWEDMSYEVGNQELPEALTAGTQDLAEGEITPEVLVDENYYFIAQMLDRDAENAYNEAIATAIAEEESELFDADIAALVEKYSVSTGKGWDVVEMGDTAVIIGEDVSEIYGTEEESEESESEESEESEEEPTASPEAE